MTENNNSISKFLDYLLIFCISLPLLWGVTGLIFWAIVSNFEISYDSNSLLGKISLIWEVPLNFILNCILLIIGLYCAWLIIKYTVIILAVIFAFLIEYIFIISWIFNSIIFIFIFLWDVIKFTLNCIGFIFKGIFFLFNSIETIIYPDNDINNNNKKSKNIFLGDSERENSNVLILEEGIFIYIREKWTMTREKITIVREKLIQMTYKISKVEFDGKYINIKK